jgi:alpha-L-rhamnosidase
MTLQSQLHKFMVLLMLLTISVLASAKTSLSGLKCEYLTNPLGLNVSHPRFSWQIESEETNVVQCAYEIRVTASRLASGEKKDLVWNSGKVNSDQSVNVEYKGKPLESKTRYFWQVRVWDNFGEATPWSEPAYWETALLDSSLWKADWIAAPGKVAEDHRPVYFRKEFSCGKKIATARLYISAHGLYQVFINGNKVTSDLFTPGWTSYNKRTQYQTYDISKLLKPQNAIGAIVGDGWYRGNIGGKVQRNYFGDKSALIAQMEITFSDGTSQQIGTDGSWKTGNGPITLSDIYNGETYDATLEMNGWTKTGFNSSAFVPAVILDHPKNILVAPVSYPVRAIAERIPLKMITTPKGGVVYDMGQNMIGWIRLKVKGNRGDRVILKFAEVLDKEGNFYTENLRKAKATDEYILKGGEEETFEPYFTFHGFRFVKLEHYPGTPDLNSITGVVIHSDMPQTGTFTCSDSLINRLQQNIQWGQKGNFLDIPTDCPQRDERLGWTGDAQVFAPTAAFNFDVAPFFTKWMADLAADQLPDGKVPDVIPDVRSGRGTSTAWGDAAIVVPWTVYQDYGDTRILENQYVSMKAWVEYMHQRAGADNLWTGDAHFGDWLAFATTKSDYPGATTDKDLIATGYYAWSTNLLAQIAGIIGKTGDANKYSELNRNIRQAFVHEYVTPAGRLVSNTQTAYALALSFGLIPEDLISKAAGYLAEDVKKMEHLTTGFVGTPLLCKALSDNGYADLAFMLLMRKEYPSWLYPVTQGATTIWERWDGQKPDGSFQDVTMNSFNHYAYGAIGNWLYQYIAGIQNDPKAPGYKHFLLQPHSGGGLTSASGSLRTHYGTIKSDWKLENQMMTYSCSIPPNSSATVNFDHSEAKDITINNLPLLKHGLAKISENNQKVKIELGSGNYIFVLPFKIKNN